MDDRMGSNINGPSLTRVPDWAPDPLGAYYLYFADHNGKYIRLAYADDLAGPWTMHTPGVLDLEDSYFDRHIASPEVRVVDDRREIWMYYHGFSKDAVPRGQFERMAVSKDGLHFIGRPDILGGCYWRMFNWQGYVYALAMPGKFYRSPDGLPEFEEGPTLFTTNMRHSAVRRKGSVLEVFYSNAGDCPERILYSIIDLTPDWTQWQNPDPVILLEPETDYEGADLSLEPSRRAGINGPVRQLRDPCIFEEAGRTYLLYSVAGEHGIAIAEVID